MFRGLRKRENPHHAGWGLNLGCNESGFGWGVRKWISDFRLGPSTRLRLAQDDAGVNLRLGQGGGRRKTEYRRQNVEW